MPSDVELRPTAIDAAVAGARAARRRRRDGWDRAHARRLRAHDAAAVVAAIESPVVLAAYEADRVRARTAEGSPTEFQDRAANTDGQVRYTAPSLIFAAEDGRRLEAAGFQPIEAYDVVVTNLDPTLTRRPQAQDPVEALAAFPYPLATAEVAAVMAEHLAAPDLDATEAALIAARAEGRAV